jgi:hypothetical protein
MIKIKKSPTADTRTCDYLSVDRETLYQSSLLHIRDVSRGLDFFAQLLKIAALNHDLDKVTEIEWFHRDFVTGFKEHSWWDNHRKVNRHHLQETDGVLSDVNLIDVIDMITDCVMAGMARSGSVYEIKIDEKVLQAAFVNTVNLIKAEVVVEDEMSDQDGPKIEPNAHGRLYFDKESGMIRGEMSDGYDKAIAVIERNKDKRIAALEAELRVWRDEGQYTAIMLVATRSKERIARLCAELKRRTLKWQTGNIPESGRYLYRKTAAPILWELCTASKGQEVLDGWQWAGPIRLSEEDK